MPTETTSKNCPKPPHNPTASRESLQCPRCESTNTKFCYYNNYSLSQPRHFCKSCRRYWTHGGSLRDVPLGGSSRKSSSSSSKRRPRTTTTTTTTTHTPSSSHSPSNSSSTSTSALTHETKPTLSVPAPVVHVPSEGWFGYGLTECNTALWGTTGFLDFMGGSGSNGFYTNSNSGAWKVFSDVEVVGGSGLVDGVGDTFAWPDLAISTPDGATFK